MIPEIRSIWSQFLAFLAEIEKFIQTPIGQALIAELGKALTALDGQPSPTANTAQQPTPAAQPAQPDPAAPALPAAFKPR